ncbi:MAG: hypothetical protein IPG71_05295 [bacterium]|nr:hypothetical protein [bacterium]
MPTYEYVCQNSHEFEEFQSMLDPAIEVCPLCGAPAERRISGGTGLIFRGSGFYITDYVKKSGEGKSASAKSSTVETKSTSSGSSSGSEGSS